MPSLVRPEQNCSSFIYDPPKHPVHGIPNEYFVRPVVRQNGLGNEMPKGFELPTCMVDPCCAAEPVSMFDVLAEAEPRATCDILTVTWVITITNVSGMELTNFSAAPIPLDLDGVTIASGDTETPATSQATVAIDEVITITATTTYTQPISFTPGEIAIPAGWAVSDQGANLFGAIMFANLCPPV